MEAYTGFAEVYDIFMDNIDYPKWTEYVISLLQEYNISEGLVLDLGCGTGSVTECLAAAGYDMTGVDMSEEMLGIAMAKREKSGHDILYLCQPMENFELYGTVGAVVSICDCINYMTDPQELLKTFCLVNNYLDPKGLFIFDMNTSYKYRELLADNTFAEVRDNCSFIWENYYDEEEKINEYVLTLFIEDKEDKRYDRFEECHYQRAYEVGEVLALVKEAGLELVAVYDAFTREAPKEDSERVYIIAREQGKAERE
ncbi:MAG: class I SAM-dependent methyltransferase [Lachnospiraceae bacterium]|nr:class I SAM-dependent methyltransferase [Lachnospiraceae bacterium]